MRFTFLLLILAAALGAVEDGDGSVVVRGALQRWHPVTIDLAGPAASETGTPHAFRDYRYDVIFTGPDAQEYRVPGYFAGDGAGGEAGNRWHCHFAPDATGAWQYTIALRSGHAVAVDLAPDAGSAVTPYDGSTGNFSVAESDKAAPDFRAARRGHLRNRGGHYLSFASGDVWVKGGPNIPENLLGYTGFDNTPSGNHSYAAHVADWRDGDPDWHDGAGKGIIGAINYIADRGANSIYFLTMNIDGDGNDTFPTVTPYDKTHYDLSKLAQWDTVFAHAQSRGVFLHMILCETEDDNETYHDGGTLGVERKLYYRMLCARFGHHNALQFNIGEENDFTTARRQEFAAYLKAVDPYDHPVANHTRNGKYDSIDPLLGSDDFDCASFQGGKTRKGMYSVTQDYRTLSADAGHPWAVCWDEAGGIQDTEAEYADARRDRMWPHYMAGGAGFEWYIQQGSTHEYDQDIDDFSQIASCLDYAGHAVRFLQTLHLGDMHSSDDIARTTHSSDDRLYALVQPGLRYAVYNDRNGGPIEVDLTGVSGDFIVAWYDPRLGGALQSGSVATVSGGGMVDCGQAPHAVDDDWLLLLTHTDLSQTRAIAVQVRDAAGQPISIAPEIVPAEASAVATGAGWWSFSQLDPATTYRIRFPPESDG